jgi:hypothetical protein
MKDLVDRLKYYKTSVELENRFTYDFNLNTTLFTETEKDEINSESNTFYIEC